MGVLGELGKIALQGVAKGLENYQQQQNFQQQQAELQNFAANEQAIKNAAANGDLEAVQYLTIMYYQQGDYQNAAYWGRQGASVNDATCLYFLGETAYAQQDFQSAENFWTRNVNTNGDSLSATALGNLYLNAEDLDSAGNYFSLALRRDNSNSEAALGLAICILNVNEPENIDINEVKQLLQVASRSKIFSTRDAAQDLLKQIREAETSANNAPQNNGGCFVTTAVCENFGKPDDCYELTAFRNFRDGWLTAQHDGKTLIEEYYSVAPLIVEKINRLANAAQIYENIWQKYLLPCLTFIERGENFLCKKLYVEMVRDLKARYL